MLTIEAARRVTRTKANSGDIPKLEKVLEHLFDIQGLEYHSAWYSWDEENLHRQRLKGYWIARWQCSDEHVGEMAYYLDDELVFTSEQTARKGDAAVYFVDQASYEKVKVYMDFFRQPAEFEAPEFIGDQQTSAVLELKYADSCLHKYGHYQGCKVDVRRIAYDQRRELNLPGSDGSCFYSLFPYVYVIEDGIKTPVRIEEIEFSIHIDGN